MRRIAFFDFDGTVTHKDTLLEFIKFRKGKRRFWLGFILNSPFIIAYKLGIISNQAAKQRVLRYFFRNVEEKKFSDWGEQFAKHEIPHLLRSKALHEINDLIENGFDVVLVSASSHYWIRKWSDSIGIHCLATEMEVINSKITGRISGLNCYGEEKVRRIREKYDLSDYQQVYCYGDTPGDLPMLSLGHKRFYKPFR